MNPCAGEKAVRVDYIYTMTVDAKTGSVGSIDKSDSRRCHNKSVMAHGTAKDLSFCVVGQRQGAQQATITTTKKRRHSPSRASLENK